MSAFRDALRSFGYLASGRALGDSALLLLLVAIARHFGPEGTGHYGIAVALAGFLGVVSDFGLEALTIKELSPRRSDATFAGRMLSLRLGLSALAAGLLLLAAAALAATLGGGLVALAVGLQFLIRAFAEGIDAIFLARGRARTASALGGGARAAGALAALAAVLAGAPLPVAVWSLPFAESVHVAVAWAMARRELGGLKPAGHTGQLAALAREARPYAASLLLTQISARLDVLLVGVLLGATPAGLYHAAYRIVVVLGTIPQLAALALFPAAVRLESEGPESGSPERATPVGSSALYRRSIAVLADLGVALSVALGVAAPALVSWLFSESFREGAGVLRLLAPLVLLACLRHVMAAFLMARGLAATRTRHEARAALLNGAGNLLLIPLLGLQGAALATLVSEALLVVLFAASLSVRDGRRGREEPQGRSTSRA